jgi:polynucleotide 5'-kinase involved in rRNA processing
LALIDLDPGQKMIGPPGTAGLAHGCVMTRLVFIGSTSASELSRIAGAAQTLAGSAAEGFIANTAGFVHGLGAKLQTATIHALRPDLIVAIGSQEELAPITGAHPDTPVAWLGRAPFARRKSTSERAATRQAAFASALNGAEALVVPGGKLRFTPMPPAAFHGASRPVCALASAEGEMNSLGILLEAANETVVHAVVSPSSPAVIQLGKMWARPGPAGWQLLEQLSPAWRQTEPAL